MSESTVALNYHLNLNHRALQPEQRDLFLSQTLPQLLSGIQVPVTISSCAEDLLIVEEASPESWQTIIDNPAIKIVPSLFSHTLAELFPETFVAQAYASNQIIKKLLPQNKLLPFGYPPELSVPPPDDASDVAHIWEGTIYCDTRAIGSSGEKLPPNFTTPSDLAYVVSVRELRYRQALHYYLRETVEVDDVVAALKEDSQSLQPHIPLIARIDLETPVFNAVTIGGQTGAPRVDLFSELQSRYKHNRSLRFVFIDESLLEIARDQVIETPKASPTSTEKWQNPPLQVALQALKRQDGYGKLLFWSALGSDYFAKAVEDVIMPATYQGRQGEVRIRGDGVARKEEISKKIRALLSNISLEQVLDVSNDSHLHRTHSALKKAEEILQK